MAERQHDPLRDRAAARVDADFRTQRDGLAKEQTREAERVNAIREQEVKSFTANRTTAETEYLKRLQEIDRREVRAFETLQKQQHSLSGRMTGLFKTPAARERQENTIRNAFEKQRLDRHLEHNALGQRQEAAEQKARLRHGEQVKTMTERHGKDREEMTNRQEMSRE